MTNSEAIFMWVAVWLYGGSFICYLYGTVFKSERFIRFGWYLALSGFMPQSISMIVRWNIVGHPPVMHVYENSMLSSWILLSIFAIVRFRHRKMESIGVVVMPVVLLMMGNGAMTNPQLEPMSPPFQSNWLWLHVFFAWIAYGAFCVTAGMGAIYLLRERILSRGKEGSFYKKLPSLKDLDQLMLKTSIFGFIALSVEIGAGALWAYGLWGRYWGWDPVETWSLISWMVYATVIHLGATKGWKGKPMAWLLIAALFTVFVTFGGIGFMSGVHTVIL
ncbi:MAG: cytochrome c biogenesis protein CcsA [bacterium]|nr:cytochrome c biogenesis protein CcsA [bacterium]